MTLIDIALLLAAAPPGSTGPVSAQLTIRETMIVRVPARASAPLRRMTWKEKKGPRCTGMDQLAGAVIATRDSVDLILRDGQRLRAEFAASCPALSYYSGFYILPTADRRICADRDTVHDRSGGECAIERFRRLVAVPVAPAASPSMMQRIRAAVRRRP